MGHAGVALVPDGVAGVAQEAAVVLGRPREEGHGLTRRPPAWLPASRGRAPVARRSYRKLNEFLKKRKVKRISVSFDAAALSQVFANNEYFANYDELISLLRNYLVHFFKKYKIQQTGRKTRRQNSVKLDLKRLDHFTFDSLVLLKNQ